MITDKGCNVWPINCMDKLCAPIVWMFKAKAGTHEQLQLVTNSQLEAGMYDLIVPNVSMATARGWYV